MTSTQRSSILLDRWPAVCRVRHWNPRDRALRLQVISQAAGREFGSMNELTDKADFDAVHAHLGMLAEDVRSPWILTPGQEGGGL